VEDIVVETLSGPCELPPPDDSLPSRSPSIILSQPVSASIAANKIHSFREAIVWRRITNLH